MPDRQAGLHEDDGDRGSRRRRHQGGDGQARPLGPDSFALVYGDAFLGRPKGEPIAQIRYAEVAGVELKPGKLTHRADVTLVDGRTVTFETKRRGAKKGNPDKAIGEREV